jgi:hypothetical protein
MPAEEDCKPEAESSSSSSSIKEIQEVQTKNPSTLDRHNHKYIDVRQCDSLKGASIFLAWEDCFFYADEEENEGEGQYKGFD